MHGDATAAEEHGEGFGGQVDAQVQHGGQDLVGESEPGWATTRLAVVGHARPGVGGGRLGEHRSPGCVNPAVTRSCSSPDLSVTGTHVTGRLRERGAARGWRPLALPGENLLTWPAYAAGRESGTF